MPRANRHFLPGQVDFDFGSDQRKSLMQKIKSENSGGLEALEECFRWRKRSSKAPRCTA
jgi:hypothetical protein